MENIEDVAIKIERTPEFFEAAQELSDFIKALPLSHADNDKLIALMTKQVNIAENSGFRHGFKMGVDIGKSIADTEE